MQRHRDAVLAAVRAHPRATGSELAEVLKEHPLFAAEQHRRLCQIRRRCSEMKGEGLMRDVDVGGDERGWVAR